MEEKNFDINIDKVFSIEIPEDGGLVVYIPTMYFNAKYEMMHKQLKNQLHKALNKLGRTDIPVVILPDQFTLERISEGQYKAKKNNWLLRTILLSLFNIMTTILVVKFLCS